MNVNWHKLSIRVVDTIPISLSAISPGWILEHAFNNARRSKVMTRLMLKSRTHEQSLYERQLKSQNDDNRRKNRVKKRRRRHRIYLVRASYHEITPHSRTGECCGLDLCSRQKHKQAITRVRDKSRDGNVKNEAWEYIHTGS